MKTVIETKMQKDTSTVGIDNTLFHIREILVSYKGPKREAPPIRSAENAADFIRKILPDNSREHFITLYLDGAHTVISFAIVSTGTATSCQVSPREIFQRAVLVGAVSIIIAHNHPSNRSEPSEEDKKMTTVVKKAAELLGIRMLDHVIVTMGNFYSFAEHGLF